ncbi:hypothetical protein IHE45_18G024100 [Dioscorea alata]|uniref:Uncharacterized protein n=1 Tax=Dioscorea alata TaxID=55571 RepID=A0ACB7U5Q0_DIOAL|nr:hypothetical protein IHE45_18G024100 [Dioscorea alata]
MVLMYTSFMVSMVLGRRYWAPFHCWIWIFHVVWDHCWIPS